MEVNRSPSAPLCIYPNIHKTHSEGKGQGQKSGCNGQHLIIHDEEVVPFIESKNYSQATYILHQLIKEIEVQMKRIQSDYQTNDELQKCFRLYVCYYNLSAIQWKQKKFSQTQMYIEKAINYLDMNLQHSRYKEQHLVISLEFIKLQLQQAVVLSQNGNHRRAIAVTEQAISRLFQCVHVKMEMVREILGLNMIKKSGRKDGVDFKKVVLRQANQKLKYLCQFQKSYLRIDYENEELNDIINNLYTWKNNFQNNEKFIRMSFNIQNNDGQRNILGISKLPQWIQKFNIGSIMSLNPIRMNQNPDFDTFYLLSNHKILQLVVYTSAAFFTLATQVRFKELDSDARCLSPSQKFLKMNDSSQIVKCKILHLKAIELVGKFIPSTSPYISHLVSSFNKNYKFYMDKIDQQCSSSYLESKILQRKKTKKKAKSEKLTGSKKRPKSIMQTSSLQNISKTRTKITEISIKSMKYSVPAWKHPKKTSHI